MTFSAHLLAGAQKLMTAAKETTSSMMREVGETVNESVNSATETIATTANKGKALAAETGNEISNMAGTVKDTAIEAADIVVSGVNPPKKRGGKGRRKSSRGSKSRNPHRKS